ncbi:MULTISPECIES: aminoglycoside phosphotransferase family protein [Streptomyces]|uniref:Aminoglycoside phosphotransferase family protein n=2 Tax=Streptomyces TaxID=1883 RepID=A0ABP5GYF9_9ACTN|nr:aminoglycoside phosphotransferase family protein [Streptomyces harbinensis]QKV70925.1 hydroxyurea phosphotransferase [Streptomyces harbinensis]
MNTSAPFAVPDAFRAAHDAAWTDTLPGLVAELLERWTLRPDGAVGHGMAGIVLPVRRADGQPAVLKIQQPGEDNAAVVPGLRAWDGRGIVRLLDHDTTGSGALLLERLDAARPLSSLADDVTACDILGGLLARLVAVPAPPGTRQLAGIAAAMVEAAPAAVRSLADPDERRLVSVCADAVAEVLGEAGDRLLHWDLHQDNVLAGTREPWLAIDPEPLVGDPGFDLWPALDSRWDEVVAASGDPRATVLRRFDQLTERVGLDRRRAAVWTLGRVLQNALWDIEDGKTALEPPQVELARVLLTDRMR